MTFELTLINQPHDVKYDRNKVTVVMLGMSKFHEIKPGVTQKPYNLEMPIFLNDGQYIIHYVHTKLSNSGTYVFFLLS